jgi:RNA polymerase sigma-70 factor, ECF subfamily
MTLVRTGATAWATPNTFAVEARRMSDDQDNQIAAGLREGSSDAWDALYDAYFDRVWNLAGRMIGPDAQTVADVVQETFLAAAQSAREFDPGRGPLWLWLAGICRNHVGLCFRRRRRDNRVKPGGDLHAEFAGLWGRLQDAATGPGEAALLADEADRLRMTLAALPDEYGSVLTARYLEETPTETLAAQSGCSTGAMRSRLARARKAFREAFPGTRPRASADGAVGRKP